jgi:hypothetical protein
MLLEAHAGRQESDRSPERDLGCSGAADEGDEGTQRHQEAVRTLQGGHSVPWGHLGSEPRLGGWYPVIGSFMLTECLGRPAEGRQTEQWLSLRHLLCKPATQAATRLCQAQVNKATGALVPILV